MAGTQSDPKPNEPTNQQEPEPQQQEPGTTEPQQQDDGDLKDKHGEQAVNRGRYDRDMKAKDDEIAELKKQLADQGKKAKSGEKALEEVQQLKQQLADEKVSHALQAAGCVSEKAAKALLGDYEGDVAKLKEACPFLFQDAAAKPTGRTGARPAGPAKDDEDEALDRAFGLKK